MSQLEARIAGDPQEPDREVGLEWVDQARGIARIVVGGERTTVLVEGDGTAWTVTLRGRRIGVEVLSWRERVLADAETGARAAGGPVTVTATLPGLVVAVSVGEGDDVAEGASLVTIEAMKMQNEVRAPRAGRIREVSISEGQAVATGTALVLLE